MAVVYTRQDISLDDYFSKYGFNDGNHDMVGLECVKIAVDILNKHLEPLKIQAKQSTDEYGKRNNCRIFFTSDIAYGLSDIGSVTMYDRSFWSSHLGDDVELPGTPAEWAAKVVEALLNASNEFEWWLRKHGQRLPVSFCSGKRLCLSGECLDELSKVIQSKQEDLPLLIGSLHDESALRVFQWRMKGG